VAEEDEAGEYACPECNATVEPDWAACPNCGVEFAPPEEGEAQEAAPPPPAAAAPSPPADVAPVEREEEEMGRDLEALEKEIEEAAAAPKAPAAAATARKPPAGRARGKASAGPSPLARFGGLLGTVGVLLLVGGAMGALVALNYDTWIQGATQESVGGLQQVAVVALGAAGAVGAVMFLLVRRRPQRA